MDDKLDALIERMDAIIDRMDAIIAGMQFMNVTEMRSYDVLAALLSNENQQYWADLDAKHTNGELHNGFPYLREDVFDTEPDAD